MGRVSGQAGGSPGRYQRSFGGMVGAMVVLAAVVLAFVAYRAVNRSDVADPVRSIAFAEDLPFYRSKATFPLLAPSSLPDGWRATSARFNVTEPQTWHLGVLTDKDRYLGLEQAHESVRTMVASFVDKEATQGPDVVVNGVTWQSFSDSGGDHALVRQEGEVTTLVVGSGSAQQIRDYVGMLEDGS